MDLRRLLAPLLAGCLLAAAGCSTSEPEPPSAFVDLAPLAYPPGVAFECMAEAVQAEGFSIEVSRRDGDRAAFATNFKEVRIDSLTDVVEARRVRVRIDPVGAKQQVALAASVFEKPPSEGWHYRRRDPALQARIEANLHQSLQRRYR